MQSRAKYQRLLMKQGSPLSQESSDSRAESKMKHRVKAEVRLTSVNIKKANFFMSEKRGVKFYKNERVHD